MKTKFFIKLLVVLFLVPTIATAQKVAGLAKPLPLDPEVRTGKLPNGFTYYIRHNVEPKNRVIFYLANKVGSILETEDQRGLAHFMEHMSFNGTKHFPKNELVNYLQKIGVKFGADLNAYTNFDETVYQLPLPADDPEVLKNGLQIMRDWAQDAIIDPDEIEKERGIVLEEKRLGKGASERMRELYFPMIMNYSRYAYRSPIGVDEVLTTFKPEAIRSFYKDWYRPNLQALIVVGDINVDEIEKSIQEKFGDLKNPIKEKARTNYTVKLEGKNQFLAITDKENRSTLAQIMIKHPEKEVKTADDYRQFIIRSLFNDVLSTRYAELMRNSVPPFISGGASIGSLINSVDIYTASVAAKSGELENGLKAVWRETVRAYKFGFTPAELERAKKNYLSIVEFSFKQREKTPSVRYVKEYLQYFLKGTSAPGIAEEYRLSREYLETITVADLNAMCKEYIKSTDRDILIMAPDTQKENLPDQRTVEKWLKQVEEESLEGYKDKTNNLPFLKQEPVAGKIIKQEKDEILKTTTLQLSNGVKVWLKPTDFDNNQILFNGFATGGSSIYSDIDYPSAYYAPMLIAAAGIGNYNASDLEHYLSGKQASVGIALTERHQLISGGSATDDLETLLELTYARFTEPRIDQTVADGIINRNKASLLNRENDPNVVFSDTVNAVLYPGNIRRNGTTLAKLDQINLTRSFEIYKERFADASNFTFVFIGNFNEELIKPLIEKYLGSLPSTYKAEQAIDLDIRIPSGRIARTVYKGKEPKARVNLLFSGSFDHSSAEEIQLEGLKEVLQIRLTERLREDESGVYGSSVNAETTKKTNSTYTFSISFGCAPDNVERLITSTLDEINLLKKNGASQVNVDKYKAESIRAREIALNSNVWWMGYLINQLQQQEDLYAFKSYSKELDAVNSTSLRTMAQKYLSGQNYIRFVLMPDQELK